MMMGGDGGEPTTCWDSTDVITGYYYFGGNMIAEYEDATLQGNYVYANGERIGLFKGGDAIDIRYHLNDHLGSTVGIVERDGKLRNSFQFYPFGITKQKYISDPTAGLTFQYTGQEIEDELDYEIYYYGARYYDPELRVFMAIDPMHGKYPSWSPYTYCANNPMKYIDPEGMEWYYNSYGDTQWEDYDVGFLGPVGLHRAVKMFRTDGMMIDPDMQSYIPEVTDEFNSMASDMITFNYPYTNPFTMASMYLTGHYYDVKNRNDLVFGEYPNVSYEGKIIGNDDLGNILFSMGTLAE